jgi:hypothetical protein
MLIDDGELSRTHYTLGNPIHLIQPGMIVPKWVQAWSLPYYINV